MTQPRDPAARPAASGAHLGARALAGLLCVVAAARVGGLNASAVGAARVEGFDASAAGDGEPTPAVPNQSAPASPPPPAVRSLTLQAVEGVAAAQQSEFVGVGLNLAPAFRACADRLALQTQEARGTARIVLDLWDDGRVRAATMEGPRPPDAEGHRADAPGLPAPDWRAALTCAMEAAQTLRFPADPADSDARRVVLVIEARWATANLAAITVPPELIAALRVPEPELRGRIDMAAVAALIWTRQTRLVACVAAARRRSPDAGDTVTVRLKLARDPRNPEAPAAVQALRIQASNLGDARGEACIVRALDGLDWPRPQTEEATIDWPFVFGR